MIIVISCHGHVYSVGLRYFPDAKRDNNNREVTPVMQELRLLQTLERSSKAEGGRILGPILKSILE